MALDPLRSTFSAMIPDFDLTQLLERLNAGADARLFSAADWAARFGQNPAGKWFAEQLRMEWKPAPPLDDLCKEAAAFVRSILLEKPAGAAIWAHTLRVTGNALMLAPDTDISLREAYLLAILHDIRKLDTEIESHETLGARTARAFLTERLPADRIEEITKVIGKRAKSTQPMAQLLHDADKLDKIGATGICRRMSTLGTENALVRVRSELVLFRPMYSATAQALADEKKAFTTQFFALVDRVG